MQITFKEANSLNLFGKNDGWIYNLQQMVVVLSQHMRGSLTLEYCGNQLARLHWASPKVGVRGTDKDSLLDPFIVIGLEMLKLHFCGRKFGN